jgi:TolB-like protein
VNTHSPKPEEIQEQLARILANPVFNKSDRMSRFLRVIVEKSIAGQAADLKEYTLALDVFDKDPSFDSRIDPVVRSEARRLRSKLAEYYESAGSEDSILIDLPKGTYAPAFALRSRAVPTINRRRYWRLAVAVVCAIILSAGIWWFTRREPAGTAAQSIAVLPFENLSSDRENEYFSDGLTEEILNALTNIAGLKVVARTSAFKFKGKHEDIRTIGKLLNVSVVLEGSVRKDGNRIRITPQLISVADGYHLWSASYDREWKDIFAVQREIAGDVASALGRKLGAAAGYSPDPEAYNLYLQARYHFAKWNIAGMRSSIALLDRAIARDPAYAPSYASLSDAYGLLTAFGDDELTPEQGHAKAKVAALKAVELDPNLPDGWATLGAKLAEEFNWPEASNAFVKALEMGPGAFEPHAWYAELYLTPQGRLQEAIHESEIAASIDPISPYALARVGHRYALRRNYAQAILWLNKAVDLEPGFWLSYPDLVTAYLGQGNVAGARTVLDHAKALFSGPTFSLQWAKVYAQEGNRADASKSLAEVSPRLKSGSYCEIAGVYAELGNGQQAISWLERAVQVRSGCFETIPVDPRFASFRDTPAFQNLLRTMNLTR